MPIHTKGDRLYPDNYTPISLTSITCKMLEHIVTHSIMLHLDNNHILNDDQHGFRKRRSCEAQLIKVVNDLAHNIEHKIQTDVILLDFQKAFDKVPHLPLLFKINYHGISGQTHQWITNFLTNRTQQVILESTTSMTVPVQSGVPQVSVLGLLLFLLYINDLPDHIHNHSTIKLFADDCIIYHNISSQADASALQQDLESLQRWEADWLMSFHPQKCQVIHITTKHNIVKHPYNIHGHNLPETDTAKYLGAHLHKTLNWTTHIDKTAHKANVTRAFLHRITRICNLKKLNK